MLLTAKSNGPKPRMKSASRSPQQARDDGNGCEFLDQKLLDRAFKAEPCCTRACASYEKGAVEICNRLARRWHPKGRFIG